ncbi:MAG: phosphatase PAP2 family protein [Crenarchaeota archaeon]|nr:phosphatase PAP2 family protein [Thermoproteota archaeon]
MVHVLAAVPTSIHLGAVSLWAAVSRVFGSEELYVALCVAIYCLVDPGLGALAISGVLLGVSNNVLLKVWLRLPRPPRYMWKVPAHGPGFPSGHSEVCASFWSSIASARRSWALAVAGGAISALVAASRVALGVHYVRDVVGGLLIGAALGAAPALLAAAIGVERSVGVCCAASVAMSIAAIPAASPYPWLGAVARTGLGIALGFSLFAFLGHRVREAFRRWGWGARVANFVACIVVSGLLVAASKHVPYPAAPSFVAGLSIVLIPLGIEALRRRFSR